MADFGRGIMAGLVATLVISLIMIMRQAAGIMPWFDPIEVMSLTAQNLLGMPHSVAGGWVLHIGIGSLIWGVLFSGLADMLPGKSYTRRGLLFGLLAWILVMMTVFPMAGSGFFAMGFGVIAPIATLISHLIFGAVLGATYGWLRTL
ncbi:DUF6789 family protein [Aquisalimonas sp.]|uniref:DUF6789 family protein n=1 Tax=Aquisalimonas sp. TaxID=1872621 RepID=UPI0025C0EEA7|nr:DUF6789 family protein [Aquisalimonas sp.]